MGTQRSRAGVVAIGCMVMALSVLSLVAFAGDWGPYGESVDYLGSAAPGAVLAPAAALAAGYIKFDGVDGESVDPGHRYWSDVVSFSQGQSISASPAVGGAAGRVAFDDFVVTKGLDKASPKLAEAVCKGKVFPKVEIHWARTLTGGANQTYYAYELKNALVTSYSIGGSTQSSQVPMEQISLNFEEIKVTYTEINEAGQTKGRVEYTWKVEEGVK